MSEQTPKLPQELEQALAEYYSVPRPSSEFAERLEGQLRRKLEQTTGKQNLTEGMSFMNLFRTRPLVAILLVLFILLVLSGVVYALGRSLGYIPGIGVIDQSVPIRVLAEPASVTREGITITVTSAVLSADQAVIFAKVESVPSDAYPKSEMDPGCIGKVDLRLSNGMTLEGGYMVGGNWNTFEDRWNYPAVPEDADAGTLLIACIGGTISGKLPTNWEIPIQFVPAPPEMTVMPIVEIPPTQFTEPQTNTPATTSTDQLPYGISIKLDKYIPLDDGYYLIGHTDWMDDRIKGAGPGAWALKAYDSTGREVPMEPAALEQGYGNETSDPNQWTYRLYGKNFNGPLTLRTTQMAAEFTKTIRFALDLPSSDFDFSDQQLGSKWELNQPLDVPEIVAHVSTAMYVQEGNLRGFELAIQADPSLQGLIFMSEDGLGGSATQGMFSFDDFIRVFGRQNPGETTGRVLSDEPKFLLNLTITGVVINGNWETTWDPPADTTGSAPVFFEQACLDLPHWKQALSNSSTGLPPELSGKLLTMHGALAPEPSLFITNLDGSDDRGLVFGHGSVSPDGSKLMYSDENGIFKIMDILTGDIRVLDIPTGSVADVFWSPDGHKVAFEMFTDANKIYTVDADGGNFHQLASGNAITILHGWSGDSRQVLIGLMDSTKQQSLQLVNAETGQTTPLWPLYFKSHAAISPNNEWIAYTNKVIGRDGGGIYISHLDGSDRRLLIQLDQWGVFNPVWSPDGKWLGFNSLDMSGASVNDFPSGVVNVDTCQAIPLSGVSGELKQWIRP